MRKRILYLAMAAAFKGAYADEVAPELDYYQEMPVVLSASRLAQPISEAPSAMTIIDRSMIEASGFRSIPDLFKLVPGMYVSYYKGNTPIVAYHGSTDQYARAMQVMIDGRSIYMPPLSAVDWSAIPYTVEDIERIEVIRGPAAASHGANSTQGVINIITRTAGKAQGMDFSYRQGDKGVKDVSARLGRQSEMVDYRFTIAGTNSEGYDNLTSPPNGITVTNAQGNGLLNNSFDTTMSRLMNYRADVHPNGIDNFGIQLGFNNTIKQVGWTDSTLNQVHDLITNNGFAQLEWSRDLSNGSMLNVKYSHTRHDQHETFHSILIPQSINQSLNIQRDDLELQHTMALEHNRLVYGVGYRIDNVDGQYSDLAPYFPSSRTILRSDEWRVFAHDEMRVSQDGLINVGGMLERDRLMHQRFSPRLSYNHHLSPGQTVRAGVSVAYRTPSMMETNFPIVQPGELFIVSQIPNAAGLLPERTLSREIGYIAESSELKALFDVRLYSEQTSNVIFPHQGTFVNGLSIDRRGIETSIKKTFFESTNLMLGLAYQEASSNAPGMAAQGITYLRSNAPWTTDIVSGGTPRLVGNLLLDYRFSDGLSLGLAYYHQDMLQPVDRGPIDRQGTQARTDVRVSKKLAFGNGQYAQVDLVVQNLFDHQYTEFVANNVFNRRGYVTFSVHY